MTALPQNMQALEMGNEIRLGVWAFVSTTRKLSRREGANVVADVFDLDHADRILGAARVRQLLTACPRLYPEPTERLLELASCSKRFDVRLRELTERQRTIISASLRLWAEGEVIV